MLCCAVLYCATLQLPAGVIEKGETIEELAVRELKEETGALALLKPLHPKRNWDGATEPRDWGRGGGDTNRQAVFARITNAARLCLHASLAVIAAQVPG